MRIGLVGGGFPALRGALATALAEAGAPATEIVDVPYEDPPAVDVLVPQGGTVDAAMLDACTPRLVQQFGVGLSGVDLDAARARGIPVDNVPGGASGNATSVAEHALLLLLALLRRYEQARAGVAERRVGGPSGRTLAGRTVAVLGVGDIGVRVATRLRAFDATPIGIGRRALADRPEAAAVLAPEDYHRTADLDAALARADDLVVCCPLTPETRGLVGAGALAALGGRGSVLGGSASGGSAPGGYVVNVGRGPVIDHGALLDALRSGAIAGAGLDVTWTEPIDPDDPLLAEGVLVTPHVGGVTTEAYAGMATGVVDGIRRHLGGL